MLTGPQMEAKTKTVTRRLGWAFLKPGDEVLAVSKCMGLKKGERAKVYGVIRVVRVRRERLIDIESDGYARIETVKEGFPNYSGIDFATMFCKEMKCDYETLVNRIEFEHV